MVHRKATQKETDKRNAKVCRKAQDWLARGFSLEQVAKGIWNKTGNPATVRNEFILISSGYWDGTKITLAVTADKVQQFGQYGEALIALGLLRN